MDERKHFLEENVTEVTSFSVDTSFQRDLFAEEIEPKAGPCPEDETARLAAYFDALGQWRPVLFRHNPPRTIRCRQLELPLPRPTGLAEPFRLIPRSVACYLDYGVYDMFCDDQALQTPALMLEKRGLHCLGDLIEVSEAYLLSLKFIDQDILNRFRARLHALNLDFNTARWAVC